MQWPRTPPRSLIRAGVALFLLNILIVAVTHAQTFSPPLQLTTGGMFPKIAIDGSGNIDVVWRDPTNATSWFTHSTDSGANFSSPVQLPIGSDNPAGPLQIIAEAGDAIDILATGNIPGASGKFVTEVFYLRSTDGGANFSVTPLTGGQGYLLFAPVLALGPNGSINVTWIRATDLKLFLSRSTDGGASFSVTTVWQWPNNVGTNGALQLVVDSSENIYATWNASIGGQSSNLFFTRSTDAGHSFSTPMTLAAGSLPSLALDSSGAIDLVWKNSTILFSRSTDYGTTFSTPTQVSASGDAPEVQVDSKGDIFVLWNSSPKVLYSRSTDNGVTFSASQNPGNLLGLYPAAVDSAGNLDVTGLGQTSSGAQIFFVRSKDAGSTFNGPDQVSNDTQHLCPSAPQLALEATGAIGIVWQEFPFGNGSICDSLPNQVFFSRGVMTQSDFTIRMATTPQTVLPGGAAKFIVTLTSTVGFSDAINLSCTNLPPGAECSFDAATTTPKASSIQRTLTVTVPPTTAQGSDGFTIVATSGELKHTTDMQLTVGSITGSVTPISATIGVGNSSNFTVSLTSGDGSTGQLTPASEVTLVCAGAPAGVDCSFSPAKTAVPGVATLTVHVASKPVVAGVLTWPKGNRLVLGFCLILVTAGIVFFGSWGRKKSSIAALSRMRASNELRLAVAVRGIAAAVILITLTMLMVSCGGKTSGTGFTTTNTGSSGGVGGNGGTGGTGGSSGTSSTGTMGGSGSSGGGSGSGAGGGISGANPPVTFPVTVQGQSGGATFVLGTISITTP
jgi:hypothetical protein